MSGIKRSIANVRLLRAALLVAFVALISLQPGLFAIANASGMHAQTISEQTVKGHDQHTASSFEHADAPQVEDDAAVDHHGVRKASGKSCEVHCAPAVALPVTTPQLARPTPLRHSRPSPIALTGGIALEFIKPPRA